ncbi:MAG TPA: hypothetical protein PK734_02605 [Bacteroidales bacterium]|nr:MAG: hypothetical protein BWY22_01849 [Bacteroidetes bacterium ADurb.Bin217]HOS84142.1 hypothetical protein [Bacteroidales bacterium]HPM12364.1 hypothetical protein [Bacteroidales bacterium]
MKTLMVTAAIVFGTIQMFASDLVVTSTHAKPFSITINGFTYHSHRGELVVRDLAPGNYRIQVFSHNRNHKTYRTQYIHIPARANVFATVYPNNNIATQEIVYYKPQHKVYAKSQPVCRETVTYRHGSCYNHCEYSNEPEYYRAPNYYHHRK